METLIRNIDKVHTTEMGLVRIINNLYLKIPSKDVVPWCCDRISDPSAKIMRSGKNYYVTVDNCQFTINANSFTIITAHRTTG